MKRLLLSTLFVAGLTPLTSGAVCTQSGHIERVTAYNDGVATWHYIYMRNSALSNRYWRVHTSDDEMAEIATTALTATTRVTVQGSASSCPSVPNGSWGNMGSLRYIVVNP
jgi:hypothetical protein